MRDGCLFFSLSILEVKVNDMIICEQAKIAEDMSWACVSLHIAS